MVCFLIAALTLLHPGTTVHHHFEAYCTLWTFSPSLPASQPPFTLLYLNLCKMKHKANVSCSACGHYPQDLSHILLDCPASEPLCSVIFGTISSILDLWSRPWSVQWSLVWPPWSFSTPPSPGRGRIALANQPYPRSSMGLVILTCSRSPIGLFLFIFASKAKTQKRRWGR